MALTAGGVTHYSVKRAAGLKLIWLTSYAGRKC
jgi:hypothetical protein